MASYKVRAYGKEYTVEVIEQAAGARIIVEGYSFEVEQAAPGATPRNTPTGPAVRPAAPAAPVPAAAAPQPQKKSAPKSATPTAPKAATGQAGAAGAVVAPIPGVVTKLCVVEGEEVKAGQTILKLEAMKMENDITALINGTVKEVAVAEGDEVSDGQLLILVE